MFGRKTKPETTTPAADRLAQARQEGEAARAAVQAAEQAILDGAGTLTPEALTEAAGTLATARQRVAAAERLEELLAAAREQEDRAARLAQMQAAEARFADLDRDLKRHLEAYREAAGAAWRAAQAIEATRAAAEELRQEVRPVWNNDLAAAFKRQCPGATFSTPDLSLLRLPEAGAKGETLADEAGAEADAADAWRRSLALARQARLVGRREGARIARAGNR
jgi:hypothetical protein